MTTYARATINTSRYGTIISVWREQENDNLEEMKAGLLSLFQAGHLCIETPTGLTAIPDAILAESVISLEIRGEMPNEDEELAPW